MVAALMAAALPVVVVNPRQVRDVAKAPGQLAKTDALDARALAHFAADIEAHLAWLHTRLGALDEDLDTARRASPVWREQEDLLRSVPGIGPVWARTLILALPA